MGKIRMMIVTVFIVSCVIFGVYEVKTSRLEDHTPPVITCDQDVITVRSSADDKVLLKGVTAIDDKDGDITDSVRVSAMSHFLEKGKRTVTYIVFDKANQAGTAQRTVIYSDYESPKIYLSEPLRYSMNQASKVNLSENFTVEDCLDGDLSKQLRVSVDDNYYSYTADEYEITVQVSNSAGDVRSIPMTVTLTDSSDRDESAKSYPVLSEYIVYTKVGEELKLSSYIEGIQKGNQVYTFEDDADLLTISRSDIDIEAEIDYSVPGVYPVEYSYTTEDEITAVTTLYAVVEE